MMDNKTLLQLFCIEKKTYDSYVYWHHITLSIIMLLIILPNFLREYLSPIFYLLFLIVSLFLWIINFYFYLKMLQVDSRLNQILKCLLIHNK